jgi:hypothetical protein
MRRTARGHPFKGEMDSNDTRRVMRGKESIVKELGLVKEIGLNVYNRSAR